MPLLFALILGLVTQAAWAAPATPQNLRVPPLAVDESSIALVWDRPLDAETVDYRVYLNGQALGNASKQPSTVHTHFAHFAAVDSARFHIRPVIHHYTVSGLKPATEYRLSVRALNAAGEESAASAVLIQKTTAAPKILNVTAFGARGDGKTLNTRAIQKAIDAAPVGSKVVIPQGVFKSGALFLKSNLTLEIKGTLLGSERAEDYPLSYRLYPYSTFDRPASLLNAIGPQHFENIRITGNGIINGNGWMLDVAPETRDEIGRPLPQYVGGNRETVFQEGILARDQVKKALAQKVDLAVAYSQRRSSLITLREVKNAYVGGLTLRNPAFHGLMFLESENVTVSGLDLQTWDVNNADGIEFGNSRHVLVFNSFFDTGDDCINFAAGTGAKAGEQRPMQGAWLFNNYFRRGHGAVVMGSHTGAWIEDILAEDNIAVGTDVALRAKSTTFMGGGARRIVFRHNAAKDMQRNAVILTLDYVDNNAVIDYPAAPVSGQFRDFTVENFSVEYAPALPAIRIQGSEQAKMRHENLIFKNVRLRTARAPKIDGLNRGVFDNIEFVKMLGEAEISNSEQLVFSGKTRPQFQ